MSKIERMSVAEVKRRFADVVGKVMYGDTRVIVERRGDPVVAIVPVDEVEVHAGRELLKVAGAAGEEGEEFYEMMREIVAQRSRRPPRPVELPEEGEPASEEDEHR